MSEKIDFVITWVDGSDPEWLTQKARYCPADQDNGSTDNRYRDWGWLRYWFRGVEQYAPWVNRVFFVTNGQCPPWLNLDHPKLRFVRHSDYIPAEYLPTFNSNVIELFLNRIPDLSEHFVLFNDDMYLFAPVHPSDFFRDGVPCEIPSMTTIDGVDPEDVFPHTMLNNMAVLNQNFQKSAVLKRYAGKFYRPCYGKYFVSNLLLTPFQYFSGFQDLHFATSHRKSTFDQVWSVAEKQLLRCASNRFRSSSDLSHWIFKYWNLCTGNFIPRSVHWGRCCELGKDPLSQVQAVMQSKKYKLVCLNDSQTELDFREIQSQLTPLFAQRLPEKCGYER